MQGFTNLKNRAINELWDMNKRSTQAEQKPAQFMAKSHHQATQNLFGSFGLSLSNDDLLIVGMLLILADDCRDMWLFLALLYILM